MTRWPGWPCTVDGVRKLVLKAIREASGNPKLQCAADGELALRFGSAAVYVRVLEAPPFVRMFSPVLEDVEADDRLLGRLNELNRDTRFARFLVVEERIVVSVDVPATPFVAEHVAEACLQVGSLADEIGGTLQKEFGGRRAFEETSEGMEVQ